MRSLTRDVVRAIDRRAEEELGLPGVVLMENAGRGAADVALRMLESARPGRVLVLCGSGNNGGDGYALARHVANAGRDVVCAATVPPARQRGDAATMRGVWERSGGTVLDGSDAGALWSVLDGGPAPVLVVDALLGTGFRGEVQGPIVELFALALRCAARGAYVLALDVPSGLDCDTGRGSTALRADATATFVARKVGLDLAPQLSGEVSVVPIGIPRAWLERVIALESGPP